MFDGAPYLQASAVTYLTAREDLAFVTLPPYSLDLHPVEECWGQLRPALNNRFFGSLDGLTAAIDTVLDKLRVPEIETIAFNSSHGIKNKLLGFAPLASTERMGLH